MIQQDYIIEIVKDFIAFGIIAEIDNILDRILTDQDTEKVIHDNPIRFSTKKLNHNQLKDLLNAWK